MSNPNVTMMKNIYVVVSGDEGIETVYELSEMQIETPSPLVSPVRGFRMGQRLQATIKGNVLCEMSPSDYIQKIKPLMKRSPFAQAFKPIAERAIEHAEKEKKKLSDRAQKLMEETKCQ